MTHQEANRILDRLKDGTPYPAKIVDFALFLTGDKTLDEEGGGSGMAQTLQGKGETGGHPYGSSVVDSNHSRH